MKTTLLSFALAALTFFATAQSKVDTLTNAKIIQLSKIGLAPSVIISKMQTSYTQFDVSTDALIKLGNSGVSADVINAMMANNTKKQDAIANQKDMNDPKTMRRTGIYLYDLKDNAKPISRLDPTVVSTGKSGGFGTAVAQAYTYGIAKSKVKSDISGKSSRFQINSSRPVFYFYFQNDANPKADDWFFATATSPNEFVLVKLKEKSDSREMVVGSSNLYGASSGISSDVKADFDYEEVADGVFKVTMKGPLEQGEYCFLYASSTPSQFMNNKVWDFGISSGQKHVDSDSRFSSKPPPPNPLSIFKKKSRDTIKNNN